MPEQLNISEALLGHPGGFAQDRFRSPAALLAARIRHHAVGTEFVAALDDRDVSAMWIAARGELGFKRLISFAIVKAGNAMLARFEFLEHLRQVAI